MIRLSDIQRLNSRSTAQRFIKDEYEGDVSRFVQEIDTSVNRLLRTNLHEADRLVKAIRKRGRYLPEEFEPRLLAMEGRVNHWMGNYSAALKAYTRSADLYQRNRDYLNLAKLGRGLMDVHMYLGQYQEAIRVGRRSLRYFRRKGLDADTAMVLTNIGNVYHRMDNNRLALQYYNKARDIFARKGGVPLAIVEYNRANIHANLNQFSTARRLYTASASLYKAAGMEIAETQAVYSLAYLHFLQDNYTEAITTLESVYDRFVELGDTKSATITLLDLAELNLHLNQFGSAILLCEKIDSEFKRLGMSYERAKALYFDAMARLKLGDMAPALRKITTAEKLFRRETNLLWQGMVGLVKARIYLGRGSHGRAMKATREARNYFRKSGDVRRGLDADLVDVECLISTDDWSAATDLGRQLLQRKPASYQLYGLYNVLGKGCYRQGRYDEALEYLLQAAEQTEMMLTNLYPDEIKYFFALDKVSSYRLIVDCLLRLKRVNEAFVYNLSALRLLNDKAATGEKRISKIPAKLLEERTKLRALLKKYDSLSGSLRQMVDARTYRRTEEKLWLVERQIRTHRRTVPRGAPLPSDSFVIGQNRLESDEVLISYLTNDTEVGAFVASRQRLDYVPTGLSYDDLTVLVRKLHYLFEKAIQDTHDSDSTATASGFYLRQAHRALIEPLLPGLGGNKIVFLVDGLFSQIPYATLMDKNNRYLAGEYKLRITTSPDTIRRSQMRKVDFGKRHNAVFTASSGVLPSVNLEGMAIKSIFPNAGLYRDRQANKGALANELERSTGFLHIAAHASRSSENPLFSRILMDDGPFFPFDLFGHRLRTHLVTLSGCQTAAPGLYYGNSFSLAKAFYLAGSRFVLASLWPVSDKLSTVFMTEFYKELRVHNNVPIAYEAAVDKLMQLTATPAYWGSFILIGI